MKMEGDVRKATALLALAVLFVMCGDLRAQQKNGVSKAPAAPAAQSSPCPNPPPCEATHSCSNYPFQPTDCWTTPYGPAKADIISGPTNLLYCEGDTYALCFFSGPPFPTGKTPKTNNPLPCVLSKDGKSANCTCQAYTSGPNFVDINGILNRGAYFETVSLCGTDGSKCRNIKNCGPKGDLPGCKDPKIPPAPVCKYVKNQGSGDPHGWLMPKANLISTFSFAMDDNYTQVPPTQCTTGLYVGCMTAPCTYGPNHKSPTTNGELVQCQCPAYKGPYQVGQPNVQCVLPTDPKGSYVWSAAYTPPPSGDKK
jgi:hypothetical protein